MKIRGSLKITKNLILPNPDGTTPRFGLFALSDDDGKLRWGDLLVPGLQDVIYPTAGALVLSANILYFSIQDNASGSLPLDPLFWTPVGSGSGGGTTLPQNQIDALDASNSPAGSNPFATLADINNLDIKGSTNVLDILSNNPSTPNQLWISTDAGADSYSTAVVIGDGLVSDGSGWYSIGQFRGPQGEQGEQGPAGGGITLEGSDTVVTILAKDASVSGLMWIATDTGTDDYANSVAIGDGLVSDGTGWINVGPVRGPDGPAGPGVPAGGNVSDRIRKIAGGDYSTEWFASTYIHIQGANAFVWNVAHNLGEIPIVQVLDANNIVIEGEIEHTDVNNLTVSFNVSLSGKVYLKI